MIGKNEELAKILHAISGMYRMLGNNVFRAIAYQNASNAISTLPDDIAEYVWDETLTDIPGVGKSIANDIREFVKDGHIKRFEQLQKKVPLGLVELMDINGFGPQSIKAIHKHLKLETKDEVCAALQDGKIQKLKGFGQKKVDNMMRALKLHKTIEERMLLWDALKLGEEILKVIKSLPGVIQAELAGSLRRKKETIGDIDILVSAARGDSKSIVDYFISGSLASRVLAKGETKASIILKSSNRQADLRIVTEKEWGSAFQYFTGSRNHNIHLRSIARDKGLKISEYGIFTIKNNQWLAGKHEKDIYSTLNMDVISPEMREDRGEIELAIRHKIPKLVELKSIQGDLQMHSAWSDGLYSIQELVNYVRKRFNYNYIVITDHSKASRVAGGLNEQAFSKQILEIDKINKELGKSFIKAGAEVDILPDGKLDLSNELLEKLDWVTASIHTGFKKDNTDRLIKACQNPYTNCIGHPMGRLIGKRDGYTVSWDKVLSVMAKTGTAMEINSQPDRLDANDELTFRAREFGVKLVINTDSHSLHDFDYMILGVAIARRAWCTPADILNTLPWQKVSEFRIKKIQSFGKVHV